MKKILFLILMMGSFSAMGQSNEYQSYQNDPFKYDHSYIENRQANGGTLTEIIQTKTVYPDGTEVIREKKITSYAHDGTEGR